MIAGIGVDAASVARVGAVRALFVGLRAAVAEMRQAMAAAMVSP